MPILEYLTSVLQKNRRQISFVFVALAVTLANTVMAHDVPKDKIGHHILIILEKDKLRIDYTQILSEMYVVREMIAINKDGDFDITQEEAYPYYSQKADSLFSHISIKVDGAPVKLIQDSVIFDVQQVHTYYYDYYADFHGNHDIEVEYNLDISKDDNLIYYVKTDSIIKISAIERFGAKPDSGSAIILQEQRGIKVMTSTKGVQVLKPIYASDVANQINNSTPNNKITLDTSYTTKVSKTGEKLGI
jgi:hypothetical protein